MYTKAVIKEVKDAIRLGNFESIVDCEAKDVSLFAGKKPSVEKYNEYSLTFDSSDEDS
ncbi:hypothetical protein OTK49_00830 [Vibrio coralliirubri]|uniref:hypothetical protein n=1 Tax=Vibrio coralliirubri TaxID=1516159 RepID=UPI002284FDB7|nr:hypothetical protein [Vibrio coralliirubri]MCY9861075.1 hypothetical protein [Vibrio coralliirubri]